MLKTVLVIFCLMSLGLCSLCHAQNTSDIGTAYHRITFESNDTLFQFHIANPDKNLKIVDDEMYFWYRPDTILQTVGGFQGHLLDGKFTKYYPNKNIALEQVFTMGRRSGESRSWYPNGSLWTVFRWSEGKKNGKFSIYDSVGNIIQYGQYNNDKLDGKIYRLSGGKIKKEKYKAGVLQEQEVDKSEESEKDGGHADQ